MNEFLKELKELMEKHEAEIHHEFYGIMLYVGDGEIEIGNVINGLSLSDIIRERSKQS